MKALVISLIVLAGTSLPAASADIAPGKNVILSTAENMIEACFIFSEEHGLPPLAVSVVDAAGALVAFRRQDGASRAAGDAAIMKAQTAIRAQAPTAALAQYAAQHPRMQSIFAQLDLFALPGGAPFEAQRGAFIGGVGVSGASEEQDVGCLERALGALE